MPFQWRKCEKGPGCPSSGQNVIKYPLGCPFHSDGEVPSVNISRVSAHWRSPAWMVPFCFLVLPQPLKHPESATAWHSIAQKFSVFSQVCCGGGGLSGVKVVLNTLLISQPQLFHSISDFYFPGASLVFVKKKSLVKNKKKNLKSRVLVDSGEPAVSRGKCLFKPS